MCGIFGFNSEDKNLLKEGLDVMDHRGPDATGTLIKKGVSLGHNRLSIIDLSPQGKQPMSNEDSSIWITFNGEIYNYQSLKKNLKNHRFASQTDTEVILHLYEENGFEVVTKLQGMFAFCIYDIKKQLLFLARDRLGVKPLYYYVKDNKFVFASEIKAILSDSSIKRVPNLDALPSYLTFRANTEEETFFKGIYKLPPAHWLVYDLKSGRVKKHCYWRFQFNPANESKEHYSNHLSSLLDDAVRCRLMSDVPFGAYLSGGLDSATIVALMSKHTPRRIKTFSVGFEQAKYSELDSARHTSSVLGTDHQELIIKEDAIRALPSIIYHADEPMADPTSIPTYFLSQYAKKKCTVILTGEGADEVFAGYPHYKFMKLHAHLFRNIPIALRTLLARTLAMVPSGFLDNYFPFTSALGEKGMERFKSYIESSSYEKQYLSQIAIFNETEQNKLLNRDTKLYRTYAPYFKDANRKNIVSKCQSLDIDGPLVEDLLMKLDKNTMAFGVEGRVPFLDYRIVEYASQIPENYKLDGFTKDKAILRKVAQSILPADIALRKKKHFFVPIDSWLDKDLKKLRQRLLSEDYIKKQHIFNMDYIREIEHGLENSPLFYARQLWALITFQIWYKIYIEKERVEL